MRALYLATALGLCIGVLAGFYLGDQLSWSLPTTYLQDLRMSAYQGPRFVRVIGTLQSFNAKNAEATIDALSNYDPSQTLTIQASTDSTSTAEILRAMQPGEKIGFRLERKSGPFVITYAQPFTVITDDHANQ